MAENQNFEQSERLKKFIDYLEISQKSFSDSIKVAQPYISQVINNKKGITNNILQSITAKYKDLNLRWLLIGEGEMLIRTEPQYGSMNLTAEEQIANLKKIIALQEQLIEEMKKGK